MRIMAWRPTGYLIEGILDNTVLGKVTGWMKFTGLSETVVFDLKGNFHRDIRGSKIRLCGEGASAQPADAAKYLEEFSTVQNGKVGDMTAGMEPVDYVNYPYFDWYSKDNGRCVIELSREQIELLTPPIPSCESDPIDRKQQAQNMAEYLSGMADAVGIPQENAISVGDTIAVERAKKIVANDKIRGMKLLTREIREALPALYAQDGKGGNSVVFAKYFAPDTGSWTWYVLEGEPVLDESGAEIDFQFFGLVHGLEKELGYFNLSELELVRGPLGLPIERDLYWQPKTLAQIAPEMFTSENGGDGV